MIFAFGISNIESSFVFLPFSCIGILSSSFNVRIFPLETSIRELFNCLCQLFTCAYSYYLHHLYRNFILFVTLFFQALAFVLPYTQSGYFPSINHL